VLLNLQQHHEVEVVYWNDVTKLDEFYGKINAKSIRIFADIVETLLPVCWESIVSFLNRTYCFLEWQEEM
jgi:hypothetical protein